jgi:acylphosphatase
MKERRGYRVTGQVQGIGYRYFTRTRANNLHLTGWVCNNADGSVEIHVEGAPAKLETFETILKEGPDGGHVDALERIKADSVEALDEFEIRFG